jgi:hypothetical protein
MTPPPDGPRNASSRSAAHPDATARRPRARPGEVDPTKGLSLDPDGFIEQQARREKVLRMQDVIRPGRTTPVAIRFDQFTLTRLKALAALRNTGYQTLLKEFVVERLYEEEKREGII